MAADDGQLPVGAVVAACQRLDRRQQREWVLSWEEVPDERDPERAVGGPLSDRRFVGRSALGAPGGWGDEALAEIRAEATGSTVGERAGTDRGVDRVEIPALDPAPKPGEPTTGVVRADVVDERDDRSRLAQSVGLPPQRRVAEFVLEEHVDRPI